MRRALVVAVALPVLLGACRRAPGPRFEPPSPSPPAAVKVLVFSKTAGFRHDSIATAVSVLTTVGSQQGLALDATEDAAVFAAENLAGYQAVLFLLTTGDVLDPAQQAAFEGYIRGGGGYVGVHSATDTEYEWPFYGELVGAYFKGHPALQEAAITVGDRAHPSTADLPDRWTRTDEWYNFRASPRGKVHVLASVDETSYQGGEHGRDHPVAWCREFEGGRSWYTAGGHAGASYLEPLFAAHLVGGIRWASGLEEGGCRPN